MQGLVCRVEADAEVLLQKLPYAGMLEHLRARVSSGREHLAVDGREGDPMGFGPGGQPVGGEALLPQDERCAGFKVGQFLAGVAHDPGAVRVDSGVAAILHSFDHGAREAFAETLEVDQTALQDEAAFAHLGQHLRAGAFGAEPYVDAAALGHVGQALVGFVHAGVRAPAQAQFAQGLGQFGDPLAVDREVVVRVAQEINPVGFDQAARFHEEVAGRTHPIISFPLGAAVAEVAVIWAAAAADGRQTPFHGERRGRAVVGCPAPDRGGDVPLEDGLAVRVFVQKIQGRPGERVEVLRASAVIEDFSRPDKLAADFRGGGIGKPFVAPMLYGERILGGKQDGLVAFGVGHGVQLGDPVQQTLADFGPQTPARNQQGLGRQFARQAADGFLPAQSGDYPGDSDEVRQSVFGQMARQ